MIAKELVSDLIPSLKTSDTGSKALNWMEVFRISHMPIVNNKEFLGLISDTDIFDLNTVSEPLGNHKLSLSRPFVNSDQHIFDVIDVINRLELTVVPVLNDKKEYKGVITLFDALKALATLLQVSQPGGIILLELNENDYSLTEIAQIVEGNDGKILSSSLYSPPESVKLELLLKLNLTEVSPIIQSFERYDYEVKASFKDDDVLTDMYKNRFDSLLNYLNI